MNATIRLNSVTLADVPFNGPGHVAVSGGRKPVAHQRAGFTAGTDQRCCAAGLIEQVPDLAKIADALLAQQRVHVRRGQAGPGKFTPLDLAAGDKDPGRMVNDAGDPAVPPGERDKAVHDQEGDKGDRAGGERRRRRRHGPADDRADGDGDREVERAELGKRASLSKPQADDGHREHQDRLDRYPAETTRLADQFQQPHHPLRLSPARLAGQLCVQTPRSPSCRHPQNSYIRAGTPLYSHGSEVIAGLAGVSPRTATPCLRPRQARMSRTTAGLRLRAVSPGEASAHMQYPI
jgi:hypothetical protein